jgi:hypothetical protein
MQDDPLQGLRVARWVVRGIGALLLAAAGAVKLLADSGQRKVLDRLRTQHAATYAHIHGGGRRGIGEEALELWLISEDHRSLGDAELSAMMRKVRNLEDRIGILTVFGGGLFGLSLFGGRD